MLGATTAPDELDAAPETPSAPTRTSVTLGTTRSAVAENDFELRAILRTTPIEVSSPGPIGFRFRHVLRRAI